MDKNTKFGILYIVATPIGNLEDISHRALSTLNKASLCASENTRNSKKLLNKYNIKTKLVSYHKYSEEKKLSFLISQIKLGKDIALISDAGTPLISDPGYLLVKRALEEGINVVPIPGPSSLIAALSVSGIPLDKFVFHGFPPRRGKARESFLKNLLSEEKTSVIFESKSRIKDLIKLIVDISPGREIFLAREMTKLHESFYKGTSASVLKQISLDSKALMGEFVLIVQRNKENDSVFFLNEEQEKVLNILMSKLNKNDALNLASKSFGIKKNSLYDFLLGKK